jgi:hypothetical protein
MDSENQFMKSLRLIGGISKNSWLFISIEFELLIFGSGCLFLSKGLFKVVKGD